MFNICNYLTTFNDFNHGTSCDIHKVEGYTMVKNSYVLEILFAVYSHIKPLQLVSSVPHISLDIAPSPYLIWHCSSICPFNPLHLLSSVPHMSLDTASSSYTTWHCSSICPFKPLHLLLYLPYMSFDTVPISDPQPPCIYYHLFHIHYLILFWPLLPQTPYICSHLFLIHCLTLFPPLLPLDLLLSVAHMSSDIVPTSVPSKLPTSAHICSS